MPRGKARKQRPVKTDEAILFWSMGTLSRQSFTTMQRTHPGLGQEQARVGDSLRSGESNSHVPFYQWHSEMSSSLHAVTQHMDIGGRRGDGLGLLPALPKSACKHF